MLVIDGLLNLPAGASVIYSTSQSSRPGWCKFRRLYSVHVLQFLLLFSVVSTKGVLCFENTVLHSSTLIFYYILLTIWTEGENQTVEIPPKVKISQTPGA